MGAVMTFQPVGPFCNDGSTAGFYSFLSPTTPARTIVFLQGGGFAFDKASCLLRAQQSFDLTSSKNWPATIGMPTGGLLALPNSDVYYLPYCSSDSWSGNATTSPFGWRFLGARIVRESFNRIKFRSADVIFSGASSGAEGLYPHADFLQALLAPQNATVRVLSDSGFFLDNAPFRAMSCKDLGSCTEQGALQRGVPLWRAVVDDDCRRVFNGTNLWRCMQGVYAARFVRDASMFLLQFRYDGAQLGHDGMGLPTTPAELQYAAQNAANVTLQLSRVRNAAGTFAASCFRHTVVQDASWLNITINGATLWDAFERRLSLSDTCAAPNCNPTCK